MKQAITGRDGGRGALKALGLSPAPKPAPRPKKAKLPLPKVNKARAEKRYERDFGAKGDWIRRQPCCCLGKYTGAWVNESKLGRVLIGPVRVVIVAAHATSRGAGGRAKDLVPLADHLHQYAHIGTDGHQALERAYGVNLKALAEMYEAKWQRINGAK